MVTIAAAPYEQLISSETLAHVRELAPWVSKRSAEVERERELPLDVLAAVTEAGCLRMAVPAEYGGANLTLPAAISVIEELARADGSVGWLIGQVTLAHVVFGHLPVATSQEIYAPSADIYGAGAAAPKGRATLDSDKWLISGRWPLVSGCRYAAWLYLQCLVIREGAPEASRPEMRTIVIPAGEVRILETYRGLGLRGSGSHDVHLSGVTCPVERSCDLTSTPTVDSPIVRVPAATQAGLVAASVMIGTAAGALDAVLNLAAHKRPSFSSRRLAESPLFQDAAGEAYMTLAAARWLLQTELVRVDEVAVHIPVGSSEDARLRAVGAKVAAFALSVVDTAYSLGGSSSVAEGSPLERRLRDARSLSQHSTLARGNFSRLGATVAGAKMDPSLA